MTFSHSTGTRGARKPGRVVRWFNGLALRRIRRRGGPVLGMRLLALTTVGRRSGAARTTPLAYFHGGPDRWYVVASANGAATNPAWYLNLAARPDEVEIVVDGETVPVRARELHGDERAQVWGRITTSSPQFAKYERATDRHIPVIELTRRDGDAPST
ncbi:nitroreductase/quinone reductase family protein [Isoptericola sediminis]|uniref:Nitroreductase family deazaflavin-dependent oxidoreductase n=1 Tax=Isoptericola sediminis TaxID=2733572 RepID=A0A849K7A1_9MICO|nr:nitroreductase/quinone reductase family protein [Isoptericola sediminis]NNU27067.1 nitroreductase family deazaflavin-dependent oxidoreductase [Isoptericola sediminis]